MILIPILMYILIILLLFIFKPIILFNDNKHKNLISLEIIYPFIAVLCYYFYLLLLLTIKE